jgi:Bacterial Ig domain/NedA-like, galactose-binding domain
VERAQQWFNADTVSVYAGAGLDVDIPGVFQISGAAKQTGAHEYAMSNRQTTGAVTTTVTMVGLSWMDDALVYDSTEYNCYSYQLLVQDVMLPTDKANVRYCEYQGLPDGTSQAQASVLDSWDANAGTEPAYAPAVRDWSNLTLFRGAATDQSSNKASAPLAVDGTLVNGSYSNGTVAQTANENHPWWQVDLGAVQPLSKIRLWTPKGSLSNFYVFVSKKPFTEIPGADDPNTLLRQPDVQHYTLADLGNGFTMTDTAPPETTFLTLDARGKPIQGQYVRVQRADTGVLSLAEVQVFGPNHVEPDRYPLDLRPGAPNSGSFEVLLYNPYHTSSSDRYVWVPTRGNLLWDGRQSPALNALGVDRGSATESWSLSKGTGNSQVQAQELDNTTSAGTEFEGEAGQIIKVLAGGGTEHTTGLATETTLSTSWSQELNMGGLVQGFPREYDGVENSWVLRCRYRFQPYYYEVTDTSNLGHQHRFPVLDYLVPSGGRAADLDRTADLAACRNGNLPSPTPQASNDTAHASAGQPLTMNVLANDKGNNLTITAVGPAQHGTATHTDRTITYTPNRGFAGTDRFTYTISDSAGGVTVATANGTTTGTVTITVDNGTGGTVVYLPLVQR